MMPGLLPSSFSAPSLSASPSSSFLPSPEVGGGDDDDVDVDVDVDVNRLSSQPAFSNSFMPAYSTRVQDSPGKDSRSSG